MCLWNKLKSKCSVSHCILVNEVMFTQTNIYYLFGIFDWINPIIELRLLHTIWLIILNYFKLLPESCEREAISFCSHDLHKILNQTSNSKLKNSYESYTGTLLLSCFSPLTIAIVEWLVAIFFFFAWLICSL